MRRYLQGTLDYACAIYAIINALSCTHGVDLNSARGILREALITLPERSDLWQAFIANETDHYWLIRRSLHLWCSRPPRRLIMEQPFGEGLLPTDDEESLQETALWLPERLEPRGPSSSEGAEKEAFAVWAVLKRWFADDVISSISSDAGKTGTLGVGGQGARKRAAIFRFHRFLPGLHMPVVSHWTAACSMQRNVLILHDASAESGSIQSIAAEDCIPTNFNLSMIRIVPESVILLEKDKTV